MCGPQHTKNDKHMLEKTSKSCNIPFQINVWHQKKSQNIKIKAHAKYELRSARFGGVEGHIIPIF